MPPRASSADKHELAQTPAQVAAAIEEFLAQHEATAVLEDGKVIFDLRSAKYSLSTEHERCTLHLWSSESNMARQVVAATPRSGTLRLTTQRFGSAHSKLLELVPSRERRSPTTRETARVLYGKTLQRILDKKFAPLTCDTLRTAMDLERGFGPAYARGSLVHGKQAWAVIAVNERESVATVDGILTLGILWLQTCRERSDGRRLFQGLKVIVPRGSAMLTLTRMAWLNHVAAQWELWELNEKTEELTQRDTDDVGNVRTRLVHHPDEAAAVERFAAPIAELLAIVPPEGHARVEMRLCSTAEMAFLLHGLEFARAKIGLAPNSFAQTLELTVGVDETPLCEPTREELAEFIRELFARRRAFVPGVDFGRRGHNPLRRIGGGGPQAAHSRLNIGGKSVEVRGNPTQDPLYRAAPERWLESMLRRDLAPLTRNLAASPKESRAIPRLDPKHVYSQVPAIAGASDRGLLDLLGVTADGRMAVIELKADDDMHFALQGLDYWVRVRHHHMQAPDALTGMGEFQRHGYFRGVELSPLPPRLYLVAPALRIHPVTETVLRYFSPRVEWSLLAIDERWRQEIRVVWRKSGGRG